VNYNRTPRYLRLSLLSACNLRCAYCFPRGQRRPTVTAPYESVRSAIRFLHGCGIKKIRFTGGEPTLYGRLSELVSFVKTLDAHIHTAVTSNGVLLKKRAGELSSVGLDSVNVSLDTLDPAKFRALTGRDHLKSVITGIDAAVEHIGSVKLNTVLMRGVNDDEVERLILFAEERGLDLRFIEFMPNRYSSPDDNRFIPSNEIIGRMPWDLQETPKGDRGAARYFAASSLRIRVGFISSVSRPFCAGCDRIRLTADGLLYTCLYDSTNIDLFDLITNRPGEARTELKKLLQSKRFEGYHGSDGEAAGLPSFSAMGG
jgi:cyclic pyranopterin phosphate synthase